MPQGPAGQPGQPGKPPIDMRALAALGELAKLAKGSGEPNEFQQVVQAKVLSGLDLSNQQAQSGIRLTDTFVKMLLEGKIRFGGT